MKKDDTISIKDAFTCKHLLPCGLCEKTDKLCTQVSPKGFYMRIEAKCKKCGQRYDVEYSLSNKEINWEEKIREHYDRLQCTCKGEIEIVRRYPVDERGNEL